MNKQKELLVIEPSEGRDTVFHLLVARTGEHLASHFCSHEGFAKGDLYHHRKERIEDYENRFGEVEVKFLDETDLTLDELVDRNNKWFEAQSKKEQP